MGRWVHEEHQQADDERSETSIADDGRWESWSHSHAVWLDLASEHPRVRRSGLRSDPGALVQVTEWPNGLGFDHPEDPEVEIWKHKDAFRVFTEERVLRVPYNVTTNPETALLLCDEQGLSRRDLDDMDYRDAQALYLNTVPQQKEMF